MKALHTLCFAAALIPFACQVSFAQEHRQLGPHVHGHGRLNIAVEGDKVSMELEVPGADIVGFEHKPSTPAQQKAFDEAQAKLKDALKLFSPPPSAGCAVKSADVAVEAEHGHDHDDDHDAKDASHHDEAQGEEHQHSEFHVTYGLSCTSVQNFTSMRLDYFNAFAGAQELDVAMITPKGQTSFEVTRQKPSLDFAGMM